MLYEVQVALCESNPDFYAKGLDLRHAWTIEGKKIKSVMDLHTLCKIVVVSH